MAAPKAYGASELRAVLEAGPRPVPVSELEVSAGLREAPPPPLSEVLSPFLPPGEVPEAFRTRGPKPVTEDEILGNVARELKGKGLDNQVYAPDGSELEGAAAAKAVADGTARFRSDARVTMVSPQGERRTVPASEVGRAISEFGFRPESKEERTLGDARAYVREHPGQSFAEGAASGFSFGLSDIGKGGTPAYDEALRSENPWTYGAGVIGGTVANPLTWMGGGAGAAGEAVASRLAARGLLSAETAAGRAGLAATRLGVAGAGEGAAFEMGRELSKAGLADDDVTVENLVVAAGKGGGLGLLTGGLLGGAGSLGASGIRKVLGSPVPVFTSKAGAMAEGVEAAEIAKVAARSKVEEALGVAEGTLDARAADEILRRSKELLPYWSTKPGRAKAAVKEISRLEKEAYEATKTYDKTAGVLAREPLDEEVGAWFAAKRAEANPGPFGEVTGSRMQGGARIEYIGIDNANPGITNGLSRLERDWMPSIRKAKSAEDIHQMAMDIRSAKLGGVSTPEGVPTWSEFLKGRMGPAMKEHGDHAAALRALSKEYQAAKAGAGGGRRILSPEDFALNREFATALESGLIKSMGVSSPELATVYQAAREGARNLRFGQQAMTEAAARSALAGAEKTAGVWDIGLGIASGGYTIPATLIKAIARQTGALSAAQARGLSIGEKLAAGLNLVGPKIDETAVIANKAAEAAFRTGAKSPPRGLGILPNLMTDYKAATEVPRYFLSSPAAAAAAVAENTKDLSKASPDLGARTQRMLTDDAKWLAARMPPSPGAVAAKPKDVPDVAPSLAATYIAAARALDDPAGEVQKLQTGELNPELPAVLRERRPVLLAQLRAMARETLADMAAKGQEPSYKSQIQMSLVTGMTLHPTMEPGYIRMAQASHAKKRKPEQQRPVGPQGRPPTQVEIRRRAAVEMSPSEQLESGVVD